ncbi:MAG: hypothetical protein AB8E15_13950 [Bdellovibrionales bacterium]
MSWSVKQFNLMFFSKKHILDCEADMILSLVLKRGMSSNNMLKPWSLAELKRNIAHFRRLEGAALQSVSAGDRLLVLDFYLDQKREQLVLDLHPQNYLLTMQQTTRKKWSKKEVPMGLFIKANFLGRRLIEFELVESFGRVLKLHFSETDYIEFRLYSFDLNVGAFANSKSLFWKKPKDLKEVEDNYVPSIIRDLAEVSGAWWAQFTSSTSKAREKQNNDKASQVQKREVAIKKINESLGSDKKNIWKEFAEELKQVQSLDVDTRFSKFLNPDISWSENMQKAFSEYRNFDQKNLKKLEKIKKLEREIVDLQKDKKSSDLVQKNKDLQVLTKAKTRSLHLDSGHRVHIGKSAKDNLQLLRKAKAWYLWMHLKDVPGSHLILEKNKNEEVSSAVLRQAALALLEESLKSKYEKENSYLIQYSEVRYVRPIKGDKLGRVSVQKEDVLNFKE